MRWLIVRKKEKIFCNFISLPQVTVLRPAMQKTLMMSASRLNFGDGLV